MWSEQFPLPIYACNIVTKSTIVQVSNVVEISGCRYLYVVPCEVVPFTSIHVKVLLLGISAWRFCGLFFCFPQSIWKPRLSGTRQSSYLLGADLCGVGRQLPPSLRFQTWLQLLVQTIIWKIPLSPVNRKYSKTTVAETECGADSMILCITNLLSICSGHWN